MKFAYFSIMPGKVWVVGIWRNENDSVITHLKQFIFQGLVTTNIHSNSLRKLFPPFNYCVLKKIRTLKIKEQVDTVP